MQEYNHSKIEKKWQERWVGLNVYEPNLEQPKKPFYNLMMFPYPSGEGLHVGHAFAFSGADIFGRMKRMQGHDVFQPIGYDSFGIHSENYAIKVNEHPRELTAKTTKHYEEQLKSLGIAYAWREKLFTSDPKYYQWTQWIFIKLFKAGLAYRRVAAVNWCPQCLTVFADEQVVSGECERCGTVVIKKELEQWFFKITDYAERLLNDLEKIDWTEKIKIAQKNWIGRSEGALLKFPISNSQFSIDVFTTRPDTLYGATYVVLAPEHELVTKLRDKITNVADVDSYVKTAVAKREDERMAEEKEKTGVEIQGVRAVNPATKKEIPIWVADYVLSGYGTGAIMAVPAHDERDFEFAKKFGLSVIQVITPARDTVSGVGVIIESSTGKLLLQERDQETARYPGMIAPFGGAIEEGETSVASAIRELQEEIGYSAHEKDLDSLGFFESRFERGKWVEMFYVRDVFLEKLNLQEGKKIIEINIEEAIQNKRVTDFTKEILQLFLKTRGMAFVGNGVIMNSGEFDGMASEKAKWQITKKVGGEKKTQYRLRDWLISRQRYWGPPIPLIFCEHCAETVKSEKRKAKSKGELENPGWIPEREDRLPVLLPYVKDFRPTGTDKSPLANFPEFYTVQCPECGSVARRETDVSDTFLDSAWYYLRYLDPKNDKEPFEKRRTRTWLPVHMYIGGAEHAVLHLLYIRFISMALHDLDVIDFAKNVGGEPITRFRAHGLLVKDGAKMSKSRGNVINPDEYVRVYGADAFRMYLMFLGPYEQGGDFRDTGIRGITRFLSRVWEMGHGIQNRSLPSDIVSKMLHKTIKKVTEDIESLQYNTAISALMILLSEFEKNPEAYDRKSYVVFLKLLAPFAPHMTEELYEFLEGRGSIHTSEWPTYIQEAIHDETIELVIQINGKMRDVVLAPAKISEADALALTLAQEKIKPYLAGKDPAKVIFVTGRLINLIIEG